MVSTIPKPYERASALMFVIALHAIALALLLAQKSSISPPPQSPGTMNIVSLDAAAPLKASPPPPAMPTEMVQEAVAQAKLAMLTEETSDAEAASSGGCVALTAVSDALLNDPEALLSAYNAPKETRSIAEAIVLWNQSWIEAANSLDAPLGPARAAVERSLASLPVECLDEPIIGPRLIPIPAGTGTIFLVFGSGEWSWRQVEASADPRLLAIERVPEAMEDSSLGFPDWFWRN